MSPQPMPTSCQMALHSNVTLACQDPMTVLSVETFDASRKQQDRLSPATFMWQREMCGFAVLSWIQPPLAVQKQSHGLNWQSMIDPVSSGPTHWVTARKPYITENRTENRLANIFPDKRFRRNGGLMPDYL